MNTRSKGKATTKVKANPDQPVMTVPNMSQTASSKNTSKEDNGSALSKKYDPEKQQGTIPIAAPMTPTRTQQKKASLQKIITPELVKNEESEQEENESSEHEVKEKEPEGGADPDDDPEEDDSEEKKSESSVSSVHHQNYRRKRKKDEKRKVRGGFEVDSDVSGEEEVEDFQAALDR